MAETTADNQVQEIEQELEKTNLGHYINENKNLILVLGVILLLVIAGVSVYKNQREKKLDGQYEALFQFSQSSLKEFKDGKLKADDYYTKLKALPAEIKGNGNFLLIAVESALELNKKGQSDKAISVLENFLSNQKLDSYPYHFTALQLSVLYENANQIDKAIALLEKMIPSQYHLLLSKIYFDLGRLYFMKGNYNQAKNNFNFVVNDFGKDQVAVYSKLYLKEIEKKVNAK